MTEKIFRAELWDQMHYFLRCHNDHMVHYLFEYEGTINADLLRDSLQLLMDANPVLRSRFVILPIRPVWCVSDVTAVDVLTVSDTGTPDEDAMGFLLQEIPLNSPSQLRMGLFRCGKRSLLAVLCNHMCFDAGDGRYFIHMLCRNYDLLAEGKQPEPVRQGSRSHRRIYDDLTLPERIHAKTLFKYSKCKVESPVFPLSPDSEDDHAMILRRDFDRETLDALCAYAKSHCATLNDLLTAAVMSVLYGMCGFDPRKPMSIACAVDLRRHMRDWGESTGLTNHVAWHDCCSDGGRGEFSELLSAVKASMDKGKADTYTGMYALPLLNLACRVVPLFLADPIVARVYNNPSIEISNIGRISTEDCSFCDARLVGGHITGAIKRKPMLFLSVTRFETGLVMTSALFGSNDDAALINLFFDRLTALFASLHTIAAYEPNR